MKKIIFLLIISVSFSCSKAEKYPIEIYKPELTTSYPNRKSVRFLYRNISNKNIKAIELEWQSENNFKETFIIVADSIKDITGIGISDNILKPQEFASGVCNIKANTVKKITKGTPTKVAFTDGTIWKLRPN